MIIPAILGTIVAHIAFGLTGWQTVAVALLAFACTSND